MTSRARGWLQGIIRETMRAELTTRDEVVHASLDRSSRELTRAMADEAEHAERLALAREAELAKVLQHVAESIDAMVAQLDAQSRELRLYLTKTELLMREMLLATLPAAVDAPPSTVRGGSISANPAPPLSATTEREIDLRDDLVPGARVEVRSHFQGRWMSGFRLLEAIVTDEGPRYRVERRFDHSALPVLFGPTEIRSAVEVSERDDIAPDKSRH